MIIPSSSLETPHFPVMLDEIIKICNPKKGETLVDCTFGGGGYSSKLLEFPETKVIAIDRDKFILKAAEKLKKKYPKRFFFHQMKFSQIDSIFNDQLVDKVIFDLGVSSIQLNNLKRGFSFKSKDKLDMSMGLADVSAEEVINSISEKKLKLIIKILGEEDEASKIAKNIVLARASKKITKVDQLVQIIRNSKKKIFKTKINPCTKTFQALRIFVNKEISELIKGITNATKILKPGGKILVVSFHSIEDKVIKFFFNNYSNNRPKPSRYLPEEINNNSMFEKYKNIIFKPTYKEINQNAASRSAKLRFAVRNNNIFRYPNELTIKFTKYLNIESDNV